MGEGSQPVTARLKRAHTEHLLCGEPRNQLLLQRDDLQAYVRSLLCDDIPAAPGAEAAGWDGLLAALRSHWVTALLYRKAKALPPELRPPPEAMARMKASYLQGMKIAAESDRQIAEILGRFAPLGVRALVLKGAAYARTIYPDPATRYGSDIDLLVRPDDVRRSREALEDLGYRCGAGFFDTIGEGYHEEWFTDGIGAGRLPVEIHWTLHNVRSVPGPSVDEVFARAVKVRTPWLTFETPDPADSLIEAAQHMLLNHSQDIRLIWINDISLLARRLREPGDWADAQARSVRYGGRICVERAIAMAQVWTGLRLPPGFDDFSRWPAPAAAEAKAFGIMAGNNHALARLRLILPAGATASEKLRFLWSLALPPAEYMRQMYPPPRDWLLPLSYCCRPVSYFFKGYRAGREK